ncbi:uncharacterized protein [Temnothorax longispinosus]|uniref:uncharacterized protein isoform X2 n=1 Tax=Temnothorax longispinosus TaxID=300112 RepID=UPI003A9A5436
MLLNTRNFKRCRRYDSKGKHIREGSVGEGRETHFKMVRVPGDLHAKLGEDLMDDFTVEMPVPLPQFHLRQMQQNNGRELQQGTSSILQRQLLQVEQRLSETTNIVMTVQNTVLQMQQQLQSLQLQQQQQQSQRLSPSTRRRRRRQ